MLVFLTTFLAILPSILRSRAALELENLALRHQIGVLQRSAAKRLKLTSGDRLLWICLSRWQRAYVERVIGSIRRERLDHVIAFRESSLRKILSSFFEYYHRSKTHLSLGKDSPELRAIQPPEN